MAGCGLFIDDSAIDIPEYVGLKLIYLSLQYLTTSVWELKLISEKLKVDKIGKKLE